MISNGLAPITIRPAYADDAQALARLAALDSSVVPDGQLVVAEVDGDLRVALSLDGSAVIADPFQRTVELIELLRAHLRRSRRRGLRSDWRQPASSLRRRLRVA